MASRSSLFFSEAIGRHLLRGILILVFLMLALYIVSIEFRSVLVELEINPEFIIGYFTIIALILSLIQSVNDKRFLYNTNLTDSIENKGLQIIGKILAIRAKSSAILSATETCRKAFNERKTFKDLNNVYSKDDVEKDMDLVVAYIHTHFTEVGSKWNELLNKLNNSANSSLNLLENYSQNLHLIVRGVPFKNDVLEKFSETLEDIRCTNIQIDSLGLEITNDIISKINQYKAELKKHFLFRL